MYYAGFQRNSSIFVQDDRAFKKYLLRKKFLFWQVVVKLANFAKIRQNNNLFKKKKKKKSLILKL